MKKSNSKFNRGAFKRKKKNFVQRFMILLAKSKEKVPHLHPVKEIEFSTVAFTGSFHAVGSSDEILGLKTINDIKEETSGIVAKPVDKGNLSNKFLLEEFRQLVGPYTEILLLEEDWDEEGAKIIASHTLDKAIDFLMNYVGYILEKESLLIAPPEVNPGRDGSIDLSWREPKARLLINIGPEKDPLAFYYGDQYNNVNSIKGKVAIDGVQDFLASWMTCLKLES